MSSLTISSKSSTENSITFNVNFTNASGGTYYIIFKCGSYSHQSYNFTLSSGGSLASPLSHTFNGLSSGTTYAISATIYNASTDTALLTTSGTCTTQSVTLSYDLTIEQNDYWTGDNTLGVYFVAQSGNSSSAKYYIKYSCSNGDSRQTDTFTMSSGGTMTTETAKFEDLSPGTAYKFAARMYLSDGTLVATASSLTLTTTGTANSRPSNWSWTSTISKGSAIAVTAIEWQNFIDRIEEFASYKKVTQKDGYSTYLSNATSGVSKGSAMKASQANGARNLIDLMNPDTSVPAAVTAGSSTITAAFFDGLKNSLNSIS